jgi:outer membrane immunogenic protein
MKRIAIALLAGVAAVAGLGYSASAADMAVKAAPVAPVPSWTGFYIGVHGGVAIEDSTRWTFFDPNGVFGTTTLGGSGATTGAVGGLQAGYNWEFWRGYVVGVESDFSWASLQDHRTVSPPAFGIINNSVSMSENTEWLSSVRGKFGFTSWLPSTMFYATGGVAWAHMEYAAQTVAGAAALVGSASPVSNTSFQTTRTGWVIGGGAEWMATTNILLRAEYLYYGINSGLNTSAGIFPNNAVFPVGSQPFQYAWTKENVQVFRIAGSYKF